MTIGLMPSIATLRASAASPARQHIRNRLSAASRSKNFNAVTLIGSITTMGENGGAAGRHRSTSWRDREEADLSAVASDPEAQSGPHRAKVPRFVAPGDGKHV
jgi:hypothetical protein